MLPKTIKIIIWLTPVVVFIFLLSRDLVITGKLSGEYRVNQPSPFIIITPNKERISDEVFTDEKGDYKKITGEPVYFDLRLPRQFKTVIFKIEYSACLSQDIALGGIVNLEKGEIIMRDFSRIAAKEVMSFDLSNLPFSYNKYKFLISAPGLAPNCEFRLYKIKFAAERRPWSWEFIKEKFSDYVK